MLIYRLLFWFFAIIIILAIIFVGIPAVFSAIMWTFLTLIAIGPEGWIFLAMILILLYLIPSIVGISRDVKHKFWILFFNLVFGWTVIVWFWLLFRALRGKEGPDSINNS